MNPLPQCPNRHRRTCTNTTTCDHAPYVDQWGVLRVPLPVDQWGVLRGQLPPVTAPVWRMETT